MNSFLKYIGGKLDFNYVTSPQRRPPINLIRLEEELSAAHIRLSRAYVENLQYETCIKRFDKPETFYYLDPPYYNCENYYGKGIFSKEDFKILRDILKNIHGKFIMSINDVPEIRELYKGFNIKEAKTRYSIGQKSKKVIELIITNY